MSGYVATIGFFDGVHLGHQDLIGQVRQLAAERSLRTNVITFSEAPRKVLHPDYVPELLSTPMEKEQCLSEMGIDMCTTLFFDKSMAALSAKEFMQQYLLNRYHVKVLVIGYDHRFGKASNEGFTEYAAYGAELGMEVIKAREFRLGGEPVSSSAIRSCLRKGNVVTASRLLGRKYSIQGKVVHGCHIGHTMGFPTANINLGNPYKMLPMNGSYAVEVELKDSKIPGMLYIGGRPTFGKEMKRTIEVHLLHFSEDIYEETLKVNFMEFLRGEQCFDSLEELSKQLETDKLQVEIIMNHHKI